MFGIILITVTTLMQAYVFLRAASVPSINRRVSRRALLITALATWAVFVYGRTIGHHDTGPIAAISEFCGMNWMAAIFLAFTALLAVDLVTLFDLILRRIAPRLRGWALAAAAALSLIALVQGLRPPVITTHEVRLAGLPPALDGIVLVALVDLHLGSQTKPGWLDERLAQIEKIKPDMIVMLGDIFEGHVEEENVFIALFQRLKAPLGVWAVMGNHETYGPVGRGFRQMEQAGFRVLRNQWEQIAPGLIVAGVDDLTTHRRGNESGDPVTSALSGRPKGATVFLSHTPWEYEKAASLGAGLMLSGHTHGGQIWPFNYLTKFFYPMLAGRYQIKGMTLIVCRGTGAWGPRMRLWQPGEILRITLKSVGFQAAYGGHGKIRETRTGSLTPTAGFTHRFLPNSKIIYPAPAL